MHPSWNQHPRLLAELNPNGNKGLTYYGEPVSVLELAAGTHNRLDWKCSTCEHEWKTSGKNRSQHSRGCPACANQAIHIDGRNSMAMTHPDLALDYQGDATKVKAGTHKRLDWKCHTCEHEWRVSGSTRFSGNGCPACAGQRVHSDGRNSMAVTHPELATEYQGDATKIMAGTRKKITWKCLVISDNPCSHEWTTSGSHRVNGKGCPACANLAINNHDGRNSMAMTHPNLALDYQGDATQIIAGTNKKLPWKCRTCEHEWKATGSDRAFQGTNCPACATTGFQPDQKGYYYVNEILNEFGDRLYYKAGISGNWENRLKKLQRNLPDHLTMRNVDYLEFENGQDAWDLEKQILKQAEEEGWKAPVRSFDGGHELFLENPIDFLNLRSENGS